MRFSTPISSVPISSKGQIGVRGAIAIGTYSDLCIRKLIYNKDGKVDSNAVIGELERLFEYGYPVGYTEFRPFIEGYYNYQSALFKMTIECSDPTISPEISKLAVVVDVPDVVEAGTKTTTAGAEVFVPFQKRFYEVPTITVRQLNGSEVATPKVRQLAGDDSRQNPNAGNMGFYLKLQTDGGTLIAGDVHWQAIGY